jgi:Holliday junction DNA helicase RuvA
MIARANGVGAKLAARIVNELKDKAGGMMFTSPGGVVVSGGGAVPEGNVGADAVSALQNLGFKPAVATQAVAAAIEEMDEDAGLNALIRVALKKAAG